MSVNTIAIGNNNGYVTSDLSIGKKAQTARMPVPDSFVYNAQDGEFMMPPGDRPYFWYNGQWNPMASIYDVVSSNHAFGTAYLKAPFSIPTNSDIRFDDSTNLVPKDADNIVYDNGYFVPQIDGIYTITIQVTLQNLSAYFGIDYKVFAYSTVNGEYVSNVGWFKGWDTREFVVINNSCSRFLFNGDKVGFHLYFEPSSGTSDIVAYGDDYLNPSALGLDTFIQVLYVSPATTTRTRMLEEREKETQRVAMESAEVQNKPVEPNEEPEQFGRTESVCQSFGEMITNTETTDQNATVSDNSEWDLVAGSLEGRQDNIA